MAKKEINEETKDLSSIISTPLDSLIGDRFGKYAKYIIQDRALPDVRDGLKPVQRRIIYAMMVNGNLPNKPYKKSATAAGFVMGHYHPHGDSSIYEAMVRMSQDWKQNATLIDMQGNNGSLDDDPPAAMRYTEARLSDISMELLKDIDKDTVTFAPNYDDSTTEPTVLPAMFPNLLVNGAEGIAAGYSTNIPPHNLNEVCQACIYRIKNPKCTLDDIMSVIPGPDFPTGGIIRGKDGLKECLGTGGGQVQLEAKYEVKEEKDFYQMIITEIPFGVVKKQLVFSIDKIRADREVDGIIEVRDETDRNGLRIVIEIRKEADKDAIISYLMKKTKLCINYNYNVIAICNKTPVKLGVMQILDYYVEHEVSVINRRTKFDLDKAYAKHHILNGMLIAFNDIYKLIEIIRKSHGKEESRNNVMEAFNLDKEQAEAIVTIQLYRLNSVDLNQVKQEADDLDKLEKDLESLYNNERRIKTVICKQLEEIIKKYPSPRKSLIEDNVNEYIIENRPTIKEDCYVTVTRDGYVKRSSVKNYETFEPGFMPQVKTGDLMVAMGKANTCEFLLCFTNKGNYLYLPVYDLVDNKWKDEGKHISNICSIDGDEKIIKVFRLVDHVNGANIIIVTKKGLIKRCDISEFNPQRFTKPIMCVKLADDEDKVVGVDVCDGDSLVVVATRLGKVLQYHESTVPVIGLRSSGVKAFTLSDDDEIATMVAIHKNEKCNILNLTDKCGIKVYDPTEISVSNRTNKGDELFKFYRSEPNYLISSIKVNSKTPIYVTTTLDMHKLNFENKQTSIGRSIKIFYARNDAEKLLAASNIELFSIDNNFRTYQNIQNNETKKVKVQNEGIKSIFDYLEGDIDDEN